MFMHRDIYGEIKNLTISRDKTGIWEAEFTVNNGKHPIQLEKAGKSIGIDVGLLHLATMSDGTVVEPPEFLIKSEKRIKKTQRALSRKKKGSNNRNKAKTILSKRHKNVKNQGRTLLIRSQIIL